MPEVAGAVGAVEVVTVVEVVRMVVVVRVVEVSRVVGVVGVVALFVFFRDGLNEMQGHFWHQFLIQFVMLFHMVPSVLLSMAAFLTIF